MATTRSTSLAPATRANKPGAQKKLGVVPQNAELTKRPKEIQAWDEVNPKMKPVLAREMEVYAGFLEHTDHHVGRLIDTLKDLKILDDTLIYVIIGDNGASAEGTPNGTFNELIIGNGIDDIETPEFLTARIDKFGSPEACAPGVRTIVSSVRFHCTTGLTVWAAAGLTTTDTPEKNRKPRRKVFFMGNRFSFRTKYASPCTVETLG
jgi:arylsulfatase A-like enzyme